MKSMNKKVTSLFATASIFASSSAVAVIDSPFKSYVGADAQIRHMNFEKGYGQNLFKHDITQGNVFVGFPVSENFRIEAGYEANPGKTRTSYLGVGDMSAGNTIGLAQQVMSTTRIHGPHISLSAVLPLKSNPDFKWVASIGVAHLRMNLTRYTNFFVLADGTRYYLAQHGLNPTTTFSETKNILKASLGFEYDLSKDWGFRTMIGWENTKKFSIPALGTGASGGLIKPHNSVMYSMGIFLKL